MSEQFEDDFDYYLPPSKASVKRYWKLQAQEDLEELADLYPEYADVLKEVQL